MQFVLSTLLNQHQLSPEPVTMPLVDPEFRMEKRTTSAGYRLPIQSRPRSSEFHQNCVPAAAKQRAQAAPVAPSSSSTVVPVDVVTEDKIWKQSVNKEVVGARQWRDHWGFLTEFDARGEPKEPEPLPEKLNMYSGAVPNTNAGNYGSRNDTEVGKTIQSLEFQFHSSNRRKKMGNDLVCY